MIHTESPVRRCDFCGVETTEWWVDPDELVLCSVADACQARRTVDVITAERHPLDDVLEAALDDWQADPLDQRTEGAVIRATLADPQWRWLVSAWAQETGLS